VTLILPKRLVVGRPRRTAEMHATLLPKRLALPVFCSDPLSSVAYATDEILLVLALGGLSLLHLAPLPAAGVVVLLVVVVASYRQTCYAYPNGGGAYAVSRANLGQRAALVAASALLVDYVLTVAVSVVAGVANAAAAFPWLGAHQVLVSVVAIVLLTLVNLRGVKESGTAFAIPTYGFVASVLVMLAVAAYHFATGNPVVAESAHYDVAQTHAVGGIATLFLLLRAFASGCTALTGVEAISNGVPNFRSPRSQNAARTLVAMGVLAVTMFAGITALAVAAKVHLAEDPTALGLPAGTSQPTTIAQLSAAVFGGSSVMFYAVQVFTAAILVLAANTAFNGFPILASILGRDGYLPRQLSRRGDRLVFSNGVVILAGLAALLVWAFDASTTRLIQLYIIGVFVSFTLSQAGMVKHWSVALRSADRAARRGLHRARAINGLGAVMTGVVLVVVLATKFVHGAWIVVIAMPVIYLLMQAVKNHYDRVARQLQPAPRGVTLPSRIHAVVLVSRLHTPTLRALAYARATRPFDLEAVTVDVNPDETRRLMDQWAERDVPVPLTVLASPYRDITRPVLDHVAGLHRASPRDVVAVYIPEYVVGHWWENLLHNQSALRLKARLLFTPGVMVTSVPTLLDASYDEPEHDDADVTQLTGA